MTRVLLNLGEIVKNLEGEIFRIETMAREVEIAFMKISKTDGNIGKDDVISLQNVDLLIQTAEDIQRAISKYGDNGFLTNMSFHVIKETAKRLLHSKKGEIQAELNKLNQTG